MDLEDLHSLPISDLNPASEAHIQLGEAVPCGCFLELGVGGILQGTLRHLTFSSSTLAMAFSSMQRSAFRGMQ